LYGHIANDDLKYLKVGDSIAAGQKLCHLGNSSENVRWHPQSHIQLILDMQGFKQIILVYVLNMSSVYANNCLDPASFD